VLGVWDAELIQSRRGSDRSSVLNVELEEFVDVVLVAADQASVGVSVGDGE
jgi:hypothetical protein